MLEKEYMCSSKGKILKRDEEFSEYLNYMGYKKQNMKL